jgi:hypothetical protein
MTEYLVKRGDKFSFILILNCDLISKDINMTHNTYTANNEHKSSHKNITRCVLTEAVVVECCELFLLAKTARITKQRPENK